MSNRLRARLGRVGVWSFYLSSGPAADARKLAAEVEELGYSAIWYPEALGKESLSLGALLLAWTSRLGVASGILNVWGRDAVATANGARTLEDAYPGRFVLGLGISHSHVVQIRGHEYGRPVETMRTYLDGIDTAPYIGHEPAELPRAYSRRSHPGCSGSRPSARQAPSPTWSHPSTRPAHASSSDPTRSSPWSRLSCSTRTSGERGRSPVLSSPSTPAPTTTGGICSV